MWKCQIRGRADHRLDQEVDVNDQHQIPKWRSAATQKNNKKKKMKESPRSKNEMKNKEKPGSGYLSGQRGRFKHPSSIASTRPRTSTRSTARQEQWMAWSLHIWRTDINYFMSGLQWLRRRRIMTTWRTSIFFLILMDTFLTSTRMPMVSWRNPPRNNSSSRSTSTRRLASLAAGTWKFT